MSNQALKTFIADGNWVAPGGVTSVTLVGYGGGGGGGGGANPLGGGSPYINAAGGGAGGGGALMSRLTITVIPGTSYAVTIGVGGSGGSNGGTHNTDGIVGSSGTDTIFGSLAKFIGAAPGGGGAKVPASPAAIGGLGIRFQTSIIANRTDINQGGDGSLAVTGGNTTNGHIGMTTVFSILQAAGGTVGSTTDSGRGGGGGGGGGTGGDGAIAGGIGGNGGAGNGAGGGGFGANGSNGTAASANSGSGGGGGGAAGNGSSDGGPAAGAGAPGGSGKLTILWIV